MKEIYGVKLVSKTETPEVQRLMQFLPPEKQAKVRRFIRWEDSQRSLVAAVLARSVICSRLKIKNSEIVFGKNQYGKPFVEGFSGFHFNLSHSGDWVVCAVDDAPVGIDVEHIKPIDFGIAERFFSGEEHGDLMAKEGEHRLRYFYDLWTLKESYIKADGRGLSLPLDSFTMKVYNDYITVKTENEFRDCFFKQYDIDSAYKLSVCAVHDGFPAAVVIKDCVELGREMLEHGPARRE